MSTIQEIVQNQRNYFNLGETIPVSFRKKMLKNLSACIKKYNKEILFLQAMPSPVKRIQTKYRYQILTRYVPNDNITSDIFKICDIIEKDVSIFVEINPNSLR